jgi:hypothetical protein
MNLRALGVAAATLAAGLALFVAASGPLRGLFGDVLVILAGVALMAAVRVGTARVRVLGMFALGLAAEGFQALDLVGPDSHWLLHLTVGSTADPVDVLAYAVGAGVAWVAERGWAEAAPEGGSRVER